MAAVNTTDLKRYLRMPTTADADLDAILDGFLKVATERVEVILGEKIPTVGAPEAIGLAIKFLAGFLFTRPDADEASLASALNAVRLILSPYRDYDFPADEA